MSGKNENFSKELKNHISEESKKYSFNFNEPDKPFVINHGQALVGEFRNPNEKEINDWIVSYLRYFYITHRDIMKCSQYMSLKGEVKKRKYIGVFNFLKKRGCDIEKPLEEYKASKPFLEIGIPAVFPNVVKRCEIEIYINKKD